MIQDILTVKIERNIYVNEEKAVSEIQILINKTFLLFSHHELLMSFINNIMLLLDSMSINLRGFIPKYSGGQLESSCYFGRHTHCI